MGTLGLSTIVDQAEEKNMAKNIFFLHSKYKTLPLYGGPWLIGLFYLSDFVYVVLLKTKQHKQISI